MCDYSLMTTPERLGVSGDELVVQRFVMLRRATFHGNRRDFPLLPVPSPPRAT
jgi:hypothetical protein